MADLNFSLLPWQQLVFSDSSRFKVVAAGRRCGKSRLAATTLIIEALKCPPGSAVLYVAPTNGQARQIIWDVLMEIGREVIANSHVNQMDITMINGAKIYVRGADRPDTLRGVSLTYAVLDEVADIKPEAWEQVIRASLSDKKGRAMFIGTPKGRNWFYDLWQLGQQDSDKDWKSWHFTTKDKLVRLSRKSLRKDSVLSLKMWLLKPCLTRRSKSYCLQRYWPQQLKPPGQP